MAYDYVLVVGPGRSGTDFLYANLRAHPDLAFPDGKTGLYYKSPRRLAGALRRARAEGGRLLVDIANRAYSDASLGRRIAALRAAGHRILIAVLLRDHRDRAVSMMRFRRSRAEPSSLFGKRVLERRAVADRLTGARLSGLYSLGCDTVVVSFPVLTASPQSVLECLAELWEIGPFESVERRPVNVSARARSRLLSAPVSLASAVLRKLGMRRLIQRVKDKPSVMGFFFVPLNEQERDALGLSEGSRQTLSRSFAECQSIIEKSSEQIAEGVYFAAGSA